MHFSLELPRHYRIPEILAFHARDREGLAERTGADFIRKGFVIDGTPVVLDVLLRSGRADCHVLTDGELKDASPDALQRIARNLLALSIDPDAFETAMKNDILFGALVERQRGLRIPQTATPFEAITWAVVGQQINLAFAIALRRSLILLAGRQHSSGLWCYPDAAAVARLNADDLVQCKFSRAKAETLIRFARMVRTGELPLDHWQGSSAEEIETTLLAVKGIGPWTANYSLLRGFGCPDCSLHGDAAIRTALHRLSGNGVKVGKPTVAETQLVLQRYKPHRSLAAAHLWASLSFAA